MRLACIAHSISLMPCLTGPSPKTASKPKQQASLKPSLHTLLRWNPDNAAAVIMQVGGMGFIHYNCTIADQAAAVAKVKAHCPGFVVTPVCMKPSDTVSTLDNLKVRH